MLSQDSDIGKGQCLLGKFNFKEGGRIDMSKYRCTVCGYIYDPALGDPDGGINPGIPFEELPPEWVCPVCGAL